MKSVAKSFSTNQIWSFKSARPDLAAAVAAVVAAVVVATEAGLVAEYAFPWNRACA